MKKILHTTFRYAVYIFAVIGLVLTCGYFAVKYGLTNEKGVIDAQREAFLKPGNPLTAQTQKASAQTKTIQPWQTLEEWAVIRDALIRDEDVINRASAMADISPRLLVAQVVVEQLRLFTTNREIFKSFFAPLKVLGNQTQFSWGVVGIKEETAQQVEQNLTNASSPFYPGAQYEHLLDFSTDNIDEERFMRITDEEDRYYAYLYAALHIKELLVQWDKAGYPITKKPEVVSTLFNIGFNHSHPHANPASGGASIPIGDTEYSFGSLAKSFYDSKELISVFPK
jgi:hypothetical protein